MNKHIRFPLVVDDLGGWSVFANDQSAGLPDSIRASRAIRDHSDYEGATARKVIWVEFWQESPEPIKPEVQNSPTVTEDPS